MTPQELAERLQARPFEPFCLWMRDGLGWQVRVPEATLLRGHLLGLGIDQWSEDDEPEDMVFLSLNDVVEVDELDERATPFGHFMGNHQV